MCCQKRELSGTGAVINEKGAVSKVTMIQCGAIDLLMFERFQNQGIDTYQQISKELKRQGATTGPACILRDMHVQQCVKADIWLSIASELSESMCQPITVVLQSMKRPSINSLLPFKRTTHLQDMLHLLGTNLSIQEHRRKIRAQRMMARKWFNTRIRPCTIVQPHTQTTGGNEAGSFVAGQWISRSSST
jgi:hypothetical protein